MLRLRLFGGLAAEVDGRPITPPASRRAWSLLAWLALHPGVQSRAGVAAALWPDVLDASARQSMRSALWSLRSALGEEGAASLLATRDGIALTDLDTDLARFEALLAAGDAAGAVQLADGDLLAGFEEEWAIAARDEHRARVVDVLCALSERATGAEAVALARQAVKADPLAEAPARALMSALAASGDTAAALAAYERLAERPRRALRVAPCAATRELADGLRAPRADPGATAPSRSPRGDAGLVGREAELARLQAAWATAREGRGGVVSVHGEP